MLLEYVEDDCEYWGNNAPVADQRYREELMKRMPERMSLSEVYEVIHEEPVLRRVNVEELKSENKALKSKVGYLEDREAYLEALLELSMIDQD